MSGLTYRFAASCILYPESVSGGVRRQRRLFEFTRTHIVAVRVALAARAATRALETATADQNARGHQKNHECENGKGQEESLHRLS